MPELQINKDLKQFDINPDIKEIEPESEYNTELMPETSQEKVETKTALKPRGRPKGLKNKVYIPNPEFNRET